MVESSRTANGWIISSHCFVNLLHFNRSETESKHRHSLLLLVIISPCSPGLAEQTSFVCHFKLEQRQELGHRRVSSKLGKLHVSVRRDKASSVTPSFIICSGRTEPKHFIRLKQHERTRFRYVTDNVKPRSPLSCPTLAGFSGFNGQVTQSYCQFVSC